MLHGSLTVSFKGSEYTLPEALVNAALQLADTYKDANISGLAAVYSGDQPASDRIDLMSGVVRTMALRTFDQKMPPLSGWNEDDKIDLLLEAAKQHKEWEKSN